MQYYFNGLNEGLIKRKNNFKQYYYIKLPVLWQIAGLIIMGKSALLNKFKFMLFQFKALIIRFYI